VRLAVILGFLAVGSICRADVYTCAADFGPDLKGSFSIDTDHQDRASIELTNGMDVGCAVYRAKKLITCTYGDSTLQTGGTTELGASVLSVGFTGPSWTGLLSCHKQ